MNSNSPRQEAFNKKIVFCLEHQFKTNIWFFRKHIFFHAHLCNTGWVETYLHPCQKCGACCAIFQVSFDRVEANPDHFNVPTQMMVSISPKRNALKFINPNRKRCLALKGSLGQNVSCSIYKNRPSPCRNFKASYENGIHQSRCDEARVKIGLSPLSPQDWQPPLSTDFANP